MDVLVSMGTNASYTYSLISMVHHHIMRHHMSGAYKPTGAPPCLRVHLPACRQAHRRRAARGCARLPGVVLVLLGGLSTCAVNACAQPVACLLHDVQGCVHVSNTCLLQTFSRRQR